MKKNNRIFLPAVLLIAGISAAFATTSAKHPNTVLETGYFFNAVTIKCSTTPVQCSTSIGQICTWTDVNNVSHNLQRVVNETTCGLYLYKP